MSLLPLLSLLFLLFLLFQAKVKSTPSPWLRLEFDDYSAPPPDDTQGIKGPRAKGLNQNESVVYNLSTVYITSAGVSHSLCLPCGGSPCQVGLVTRSG